MCNCFILFYKNNWFLTYSFSTSDILEAFKKNNFSFLHEMKLFIKF